MTIIQTLELIFVTLTENSSVVTNDTQEPQKYPHHQKKLKWHTSMGEMTLKLPQYFNLLMENLLVATSKFGFLTVKRHSVTRKHLFL